MMPQGLRWLHGIHADLQFRSACKRLLYAACYSHAPAQAVGRDFYAMYLMGGEL